MKHWRVDYSVKYINGETEELAEKIEARNITVALGQALTDIVQPARKKPEISDVVIWNIGIMEDEVFPEEGDEGGE